MVGRAYQHDVEILLLEHVAVVGVGARFLLRFLPASDNLGGIGECLLVHIAKRHDLDGRHLNEAEQIDLAVPAATDQSDTGRFGPVGESCGKNGSGCRGGDELAAVHKRVSGWKEYGEPGII